MYWWMKSRITVLEGEGEGEGEGKGEKEGKEGDVNKSFTQEQVNEILAKDRRKHQQQSQKYLDELNALKAKSSLTDKEREELDSRIETLQNELLTKEELAKQKTDKIEKTYKKQVDELANERETWRSRFTTSTIERAITEAAVANNAFSPSQIVAMLSQNTRLEEVVGEDGKGTGEFVVKTKLTSKNEEGKSITLDLQVGEAVKRMSESDEYLNLFKSSGFGGAGSTNRSSAASGEVNWAKLAENPEAYRKARAEGKMPT